METIPELYDIQKMYAETLLSLMYTQTLSSHVRRNLSSYTYVYPDAGTESVYANGLSL
jgi:hypothetical protein